MASTLGGLLVIICFLSTSTSSLMLLITSLWSLPLLTWLITYVCDDVWPVCWDVVSFGLRYTVWVFRRPSPSAFFWNMVFMILYFLDVAILPRCRLFRFSIQAQICPLPFPQGLVFCLFEFALKSPITTV